MRSAVFALLALVAAVALASENVVVVTPDNYDSLLDGSNAVFLKVYAPWCGHCKQLAPTWDQLGDAFAKQTDRVIIAKLDADAHKDLGQKLGVGGFPTLLFFPRGAAKGAKPETYDKGRDLEALAEFVSEKTGASSRIVKPVSHVKILTPENFNSVVGSDRIVLVEFFAPWCGHCKQLAPKYEKVAAIFEREPSVVVASLDCQAHGELCEKFGVSGYPTIKYFKAGSTDALEYPRGREIVDFVDFFNAVAGTKRETDGSLLGTAGRIEAFDALAKGFAVAADKDAIIAKAKAIKADNAQHAKFYVAAFEAIAKKGVAHITAEIERLTRLAKQSGITGAKLDEFSIRKNILGAFNA